jgi:hypothetical protein
MRELFRRGKGKTPVVLRTPCAGGTGGTGEAHEGQQDSTTREQTGKQRQARANTRGGFNHMGRKSATEAIRNSEEGNESADS